MVVWFRNCSSGFRIGVNSKSAPTVFGVQNPGRSPSGTKIAPNRRCGFAAVLAMAVNAGSIYSSNGNARVTPMPRRNVRRGNDILVMNMVASSLLLVRLLPDVAPGPARAERWLTLTRPSASSGREGRILDVLSHLGTLLKRRAVHDAQNQR